MQTMKIVIAVTKISTYILIDHSETHLVKRNDIEENVLNKILLIVYIFIMLHKNLL